MDRFSKIYPLHIFTLITSLVLLGIPTFSLIAFLANITLLQAWLPKLSTVYVYNSVSWALSVEVFLYLCFPFIFRIAIKKITNSTNMAWLLIIIGISVPTIAITATSIFNLNRYPIDKMWSAHYFLYRFPITRLGDLIIGMGLAFIVYNSKPVSKKIAYLLQIASALLYILVASQTYRFQSFSGASSFDLIWIPVFSLAIYSLAIPTLKESKHIFSSKPLVELGTLSFAFYLFHDQIYIYLMNHGAGRFLETKTSYLLFISILLFGLVILSWFTHKFIEQPTQLYIRNKFSKKEKV